MNDQAQNNFPTPQDPAYAGEQAADAESQVAPAQDIKPRKEGDRDDQLHTMSDDEKVDEAIDESFPASDPPAHHNFQ